MEEEKENAQVPSEESKHNTPAHRVNLDSEQYQTPQREEVDSAVSREAPPPREPGGRNRRRRRDMDDDRRRESRRTNRNSRQVR